MDRWTSRVGLEGLRKTLLEESHSSSALALATAFSVTVGCGEPCPDELLPGICAASRTTLLNGASIRDAVLVDLDGDGRSELVGVGAWQIHIAQRDGRRWSQTLQGSPSALVSGDFDGDGRPELALELFDDEEGHRLGFFAAGRAPEGEIELVETMSVRPTEMGGGPLWAADLDGDGRDEVVLMDRQAEAIITVEGLSGELRKTPLGAIPVALDLGDLNGDGLVDLAVADFVGAQLILLFGDGEGGFAAPVHYPSAIGLDSVAIGDLNDDGADDLVARGGLGELWMYLGDGAGGFGEPSTIALVSEGGGSGLAVVPRGSDGVGGVMVAEDGALSTYLMDHEGSLLGRARGRSNAPRWRASLRLRPSGLGEWLLLGDTIEELGLAEEPRPVEAWRRESDNPRLDRWTRYAVGDVDRDGVPDIVALRESREREVDPWEPRAELFLGDGEGDYAEAGSLPAEPCASLIVGDFDGDGRGDLLGIGAPTAPWVSFGESASEGVIPLAVGENELWSAVSPIEGGTQTRVVMEIRSFDEDRSRDRIELLRLGDGGELVDSIVLTEGLHYLGHWVRDLDGDGDDDLLAVARDAEGRALLSWFAEDDQLLPGPVHSIDQLTGWSDDIPLAGVGVGVLDGSDDAATPEVVIAGEGGIARLRGIDGPAPSVSVEPGDFDPYTDRSPFPFAASGRMASLTIGDLDGDEAIDVVRCGERCSAVFADDGGLAGGARPVAVPRTIGALDLDGDRQLDFLVGDEASFGSMLMATHAGPSLLREWRHFGLERTLLGDLDGDGASEIVVATPLGISTFWRVGRADQRTFALELDWAVGPRVAAIADLDGDGRDALVVAPLDLPGQEGVVALVRWDGAGLRVEGLDAPGMRPRFDLQVLDLDGDGADDLLAADRDGVVIAYGIEPGRFRAAERVTTPLAAAEDPALAGDGEVELHTVDLNRDGRPELIRLEQGSLAVLWGREGRSWGVSTIGAEGFVVRGEDLLIRRGDTLYRLTADGEALRGPRRVADDPGLEAAERMLSGGDLDGDGFDDLVTVHGLDLWVWLSRGAGLRAPHILRSWGAPGGRPTMGDVDGGGRAEIILGLNFGLTVLWGEGDP